MINGWLNKKVKDICFVGRGRVISQKEIDENPGIYPVYSSQSFNQGEMGKIGTYDFVGEYVTWTTDGAYAGTVFHRDGKFNCTNVCGTLKEKNSEELDLKFLSYKLATVTKKYVSYVGNPKLMNTVVSEISIDLPKLLSEQTRIAEILSTADKAIEQTGKLIAKYQRIKTGLMQDLLTKGIDEHGNIRSKATHKFVVKKGIEVPEEWEVEKLIDLCYERRNGIQTGPFGAQLHASDYVEEGVPLILIRNIVDGKIIEKDIPKITPQKVKELKRYQIEKDDIIFSRVGDVGRVSIAEEKHNGWLISGQMLRARLRNPDIDIRFIKYLIQTFEFKQRLKKEILGTTRESINTKILEELLICVPKKVEQNIISDTLERIDATVDELFINKSKQHSIKTGLMQDLLSGRVRVKVEGSIDGY